MKISVFGISKAVILFFIMILLILSFFGNNVNNIGLFLFVVYLSMVFFYRPIEYANNLLFFIIIIPMLIGGALIEGGSYLFEIEKYTYWNGTFLVNLFFSIIFFEFLTYPVKSIKPKLAFKINKTYVEGVIVVALLILYITFMSTGIPLLNGTHRSIYFSSIVPDYVNLIKGRLSFVCLALGCYYFNYKEKRYLLYFVLIIVYHILCSIKGGELLIIIYSFFLPMTLYYTVRYSEIQKRKLYGKIRALLLFLVVGIFTLVLINYQTVENYDSDTTALEKIEKRIEAAGQIWWMINDQSQVSETFRWDKFVNNFKSGDKYSQGMNQLMNEVVPEKSLSSWRDFDDRGRSLANGFPAIGFYYFGYIGVIILTIILGSAVILIKKDILTTFESGDILSFLFIGPILELIIRVVAQGDINLFFETRTYIIFIAYIFYGLVKRSMMRNKIA